MNFLKTIEIRICEYFDVTYEQLVGTARKPHFVIARQIAWYSLKNITDSSSVAIGRMYNRDHTTILYGWRQVEQDPYLRQVYDNFIQNFTKFNPKFYVYPVEKVYTTKENL